MHTNTPTSLPQNYSQIFQKELTIHGFLVGSLRPKYTKQFYAEMVPLVKEGKLKHREDVTVGLEGAGKSLVDTLTGKNFGKTVVLVAEE